MRADVVLMCARINGENGGELMSGITLPVENSDARDGMTRQEFAAVSDQAPLTSAFTMQRMLPPSTDLVQRV